MISNVGTRGAGLYQEHLSIADNVYVVPEILVILFMLLTDVSFITHHSMPFINTLSWCLLYASYHNGRWSFVVIA